METAFLATLYVLFFIEVGTRRIYITSATRNPDGAFCAQQARNLAMEGQPEHVRFLIRDRDAKYTRAFDEVSAFEGTRVIKTPVRTPRANAPDGPVQPPTGLPDRIERTDILGGLIHEYHAVAA